MRVRRHDQFERDGDHLLVAMPMSFTQAALGAQLEVPTLNGAATLSLPVGTQHGALFRINDRGLPNLRTGNRGDLVVIMQLVVPQKLTEEQKRLLGEYAKSEELEVGTASHSLWEKIKDAVSGG